MMILLLVSRVMFVLSNYKKIKILIKMKKAFFVFLAAAALVATSCKENKVEETPAVEEAPAVEEVAPEAPAATDTTSAADTTAM
jgi:hypothetical protein